MTNYYILTTILTTIWLHANLYVSVFFFNLEESFILGVKLLRSGTRIKLFFKTNFHGIKMTILVNRFGKFSIIIKLHLLTVVLNM